MKRRILAYLLIITISIFLAACGNSDSVKVNEIPSTDEGTTGQGVEQSREDAGAGTEDGNNTETMTALRLMQQYNRTPLQIIDDKYRTFYEVFVYSFYDGNGDGIGDFKGLTEKLDYINDGDESTDTDLGCNGIWLMPAMPSTTYHKYDVIDYFSIDPEYGAMEDFEEFMAACEERDIHVLLDLVMNHSSSGHEWFTAACDYLRTLGDGEPDPAECPYVDYYFFTKEKVNNSYYRVSGTDWYYEGSFWSEMPDLNLMNDGVRDEFAQIIAFWLEKGVAGFRIDAAIEFVSGNTTANVEILSWLNETVKDLKEDAYIVAEVWTDIGTYEKYYESGIDSVFNFAFAEQDGIIGNALNRSSGSGALSYGKATAALEERFSAFNPDYIDAPFYTNHDLGRSAGYYSGDGSTEKTKMAQAMNLMMTGNVFLYYGEELGMKGAGRDENKRAPMYWMEDSSGVGMCRGPIDMDTVKMKFPSLEVQEADGDSVYHFVKEAIGLRNRYPAILRGSVTCIEELSDENVCVIRKEYEGQEILLLWNLGEASADIDVSTILLKGESAAAGTIGGALLTGRSDILKDGGMVTLPGYSMVLLAP